MKLIKMKKNNQTKLISELIEIIDKQNEIIGELTIQNSEKEAIIEELFSTKATN